MNVSNIRKRVLSPFLKRKKEEETTPDNIDHLLYEFDVSGSVEKTEEIKKAILLSPYSLLINPKIKINQSGENDSVTVSFFVLNKQKGKEIENLILNKVM